MRAWTCEQTSELEESAIRSHDDLEAEVDSASDRRSPRADKGTIFRTTSSLL
jgi:hypothetical protein